MKRKENPSSEGRNVAVLTGAAGGMGKALTEELLRRGWRVFALDREKIGEKENLVPVVCDVTDETSVRAAFDEVRSRTASLSAIVHLAGIYRLDSLFEMETEEFRRIVKVNGEGAFLVNKVFSPLLRKDSRILILTSELAVRDPLPFTGIYGITKTFSDRYAYALRMEAQLLGIRVSVLRAGAVDTPLLSDSTGQLDAFCKKTKLYPVNAGRFRRIVEKVEAKKIPPEKPAKKAAEILGKRKPKFSYSINRNPLLILFDLLPKKLRFFLIRTILKP